MKLGDHKQHFKIDLFIFLPSTISRKFPWSATPLYLSQYFSQKAKTLLSLICITSLMTTSVQGPRSTRTEEKIAVGLAPQFPYSLVTDYSFSHQSKFSSLRVVPLEPLLPPFLPLTCHHSNIWGPQWERRGTEEGFPLTLWHLESCFLLLDL